MSVSIPTDRMSGRPRGFAFVEFGDPDQAERAVRELDGRDLVGRPVRTDSADDAPPGRGGAPGGGKQFRTPDARGDGGGGFGGKKRKSGGGSRRGQRGKKRSL